MKSALISVSTYENTVSNGLSEDSYNNYKRGSSNNKNNRGGFFLGSVNEGGCEQQHQQANRSPSTQINTSTMRTALSTRLHHIQQRVLQTQLTKLHSLNLHRHLPATLKHLQSITSKYSSLQTHTTSLFSSQHQQLTLSTTTLQHLEQQVSQLQAELFQLESEGLLKQQLEKQLLLGVVDGLEERVKGLYGEKQIICEEKEVLIGRGRELERECQEERKRIIELVQKRQRVVQELNYVKHCELEPIHLLKEKNLAQFVEKSHQFKQMINSNNDNNDNIPTIYSSCHHYQSLTLQQSTLTTPSTTLTTHLHLQHNLKQLQTKLRQITQEKIRVANEIELEEVKGRLLREEVMRKQEEAERYGQLLGFVEGQPIVLVVSGDDNNTERLSSNNQQQQQPNQMIVTLPQLSQTVESQHHLNLHLRQTLLQHQTKLSLLLQTNTHLKSLFKQTITEESYRKERKMVENGERIRGLEERRVRYGGKLVSEGNVIGDGVGDNNSRRDYPIPNNNNSNSNNPHPLNQQPTSPTYHFPLPFALINPNTPTPIPPKPSLITPKPSLFITKPQPTHPPITISPQSLPNNSKQSKLLQLRLRLMAQFERDAGSYTKGNKLKKA